ncbi:hypothetical protein PHJA_000771500 [Phtheirospermum japonicum]|uniref:Uncharacterized protein n=1 Tax=Phtheirospermum japonicum TaxID=374723 RepID=A0A830BG81_9LAMI|nr:hypothetical protein PHJA_000771500 [Phtheirospermum japonicum]
MKPTPISVRTYRGTGKSSSSQDEHEIGHSFGQPYFDTRKPESEKQNPSTEKVGPASKSSEQNARKHRPGNRTSNDDDDNELVKYMSNLPCFLQQQMEKETNVQEKALNFGVLDWKRLEKWKYTKRMPVKYSSQKIGQDSKKQSSSHVRIPSSGKMAVPHGSRFGSPKEDKYAELVKSKGKESCDQEIIGTVRLRDHFHQRVKSYDESKKSDPSKETVSEKEPSNNSNNSSDPQNILLIKPKHFPKSSSESCPFTEMVGNRLSDFLSPQELQFAELSTETVSPSSFLEASDKKGAEISEHVTLKERAPSPMRRLSFDLGRMSRSLSFKDNSIVPQLGSAYTSAKSGPARPEIPSGIDKFKSDRANASGRARSSPLRRLLDPLMKRKGAHHPVETETVSSPSSKGPSQDKKPDGSALHKDPSQDRKPDVSTLHKGPSQDRKSDGSTLQALLQLTFKNGLPFFKLVVNNTNDMLAAAVKRLPTTSGKADPCLVYAFYSVREIKKKSMNWMNQGPKSKSCGLGYNIVGQMNISSSGERESRECVLYGVDPGQVDKQTLDYVPDKEIAAVVVGNSSKVINDENKDASGIVVILPGGVHGVPTKCEPSSLISRFGGSCDCGGWDVGCKLRVLADDKKPVVMPSDTIDHINLYLEGGEKENKPVFGLKPFSNGYYSIEFDASISLLEAFATCVAYVTCLKFPELTDAKSPSGREHFPELIITGTDKKKTATTFQEQLPAYVTCPPLSPVGRI